MTNMDYELFPGKNLSGLFKDIYKNQQTKKRRISELIYELKNAIRKTNNGSDISDVALLYPIIKDLVDSAVKNDDSLIKMAVIVQRIMASENKTEGESGFLTEKEKQQLLNDVKDLGKDEDQETDDIADMENDINKIKEKLELNEPENK